MTILFSQVKEVDTLSSLRKALLTEITDLSFAYLVTIQIRCFDEGLLVRHGSKTVATFFSRIIKCQYNKSDCLLIFCQYKRVKLTIIQLDLKALNTSVSVLALTCALYIEWMALECTL